MNLHTALVKIEEEKISSKKAKNLLHLKKMVLSLFLLEESEMKIVEKK